MENFDEQLAEDPLFGAALDTLAIRVGQSRSHEGEHSALHESHRAHV
jgi:O-succinylhomoserine sulfhydrylase